MKYILQIFTGPWHAPEFRPEDIIRQVDAVASVLPVEKVIIGWNTDPVLYEQVGAFLHRRGIQMLLWLPVFSEVSAIAVPDEALDVFGRPVVTPIRQPGEDFLFGCPTSPHNLGIVREIYETYFSHIPFDGVFLDKIRSQSFVSGVSGVLSCGCDRCRQAFRQHGVDLAEIRQGYEAKKDAFFDLAAYPMSGAFEMRDPAAQRFFLAKEEILAESVTEITRYFKEKGLIVGLDLFAPVVSRFVGQNYARITEGADFIKPMLYRRTDAPAGIAYEYALFAKHAPQAEGRPPLAMDLAFLETQLAAIHGVACTKYPGIEINYRADIARTDAAYITESLTAIRDFGFEGASLCWNVMLAPPTHIEAVAAVEKM